MSGRSHDSPLVVFTSLAIAGAGTVGADALLTLAGRPPERAVAGLGAGLLLTGLAASLWHLGRWRRFPLAGRRFARSPLSTEVVLGTVALAAAFLMPLSGYGYLPQPLATALAGGSAVAFLVSIGLVYRVGGQLTWRGASALIPLSAGLACGVSFVEGLGADADVAGLSMIVLLADAAVLMLRWRTVTMLAVDGHSGLSAWFDRRHELLMGRFLLLDAVPFVLLAVAPSPVAAVAAAAGLVIDRFGFYALGVQQTTERQMASVERTIEKTLPPHEM